MCLEKYTKLIFMHRYLLQPNVKNQSQSQQCSNPLHFTKYFCRSQAVGILTYMWHIYCSHRCTKAGSDIVGREALVNPQLTGGCSTPPEKWQHVWLGQAEPGAAKAEPAGVELTLSAHCWLGAGFMWSAWWQSGCMLGLRGS